MGVPAPAQPAQPMARPTASGAAQRARAKAKQQLTITVLASEDQEYATAIHRLNATGWAGDPAALSDWAHEREELLTLLWQARQELYAALGVGLGHENRDYLTLRWMPICGPAFIGLVRVLRERLFLNRATGELRELWFEEGAELATAMGVSPATFWRLMKRIRTSAAAPVYKQFVIRRTRRRYDASAQATRVTSNQYLVAMEDPLTPDDADWVEARAYELLAEQRRAAPGATGATAAPPPDDARCEAAANASEERRLQGESLNALSLCESERSIKVIEQRDQLLEINQERGSYRSPDRGDDGFRVASAAIGNADPQATGTQNIGAPTGIAQGTQEQANERSEIASNRQSKREEMFRAAPPTAELPAASAVPATAVLSELEVATATAIAVIEGVAGDILDEFGDARPRGGVKQIAEALARAGAPQSVMCDLIYVARARVRAFQSRGGHIRTTVVGYFISAVRGLIIDAREKYAWDVEKIRADDEKAQASKIIQADTQARQAHRERHQGSFQNYQNYQGHQGGAQRGYRGYSGYQPYDRTTRRR